MLHDPFVIAVLCFLAGGLFWMFGYFVGLKHGYEDGARDRALAQELYGPPRNWRLAKSPAVTSEGFAEQ